MSAPSKCSLLEFHAFLAGLGWPANEYIPPDIPEPAKNVRDDGPLSARAGRVASIAEEKRPSLGLHRLVGSMRIENAGNLGASSGVERGENVLQYTDFGHVLNIFVNQLRVASSCSDDVPVVLHLHHNIP